MTSGKLSTKSLIKFVALNFNENLDIDVLLEVCRNALDSGCLKIARSALTLALIQCENAEKGEAICEEISNYHNDIKEGTKEILDNIWKKDLDAYSEQEQTKLIKALLINEQSRLAELIIDSLNIEDELINSIVKLEAGRIKFNPSNNSSRENIKNSDAFWALCDEDYPLPRVDESEDNVDNSLNAINPEQIYFNAHLTPKRLLIPINAYKEETHEYNFDHPAIDTASLLWEQSMPEAPYWEQSMKQEIQLVNLNQSRENSKQENASIWPSNIQTPKEIICRIGMASIIDSIWHNELQYNQQIYIINDYCPSSIIENVTKAAAGIEEGPELNENLAKFATHTAYLFKLAKEKIIIDISPANLLHLPTTLNLPSPVKFALIDFKPEQLKYLVQASCFANCPYPIPFLFEDDILLDICKSWQEVNIFIKERIQESRILSINEETLGFIAKEHTSKPKGHKSFHVSDASKAKQILELLRHKS